MNYYASFLIGVSCWVVVRQSPVCCQATIVRQLSGSCLAVIKQSSDRQAVDEKMNQWFQGTPEESCFLNRGRGRGQTSVLCKRHWDKQVYLFSAQKGTIPDYNNFPGIKRGQTSVLPSFRGREGDSTFNGFILSTVGLYHFRV
jgi:hypothetical protein